MEKILEGLNEAQRTAVTTCSSVLQVLAPPGSGKTKTLTSRVGHLIAHNGLQPQNVIVCTFTVKAATEMENRIAGFLGKELATKLVLGTFHSIARRYLAKYGPKIGLSEKFGIADTSDTTAIITRIVKAQQLSILPAQARSRISTLKSRGLSAEQFSRSSKSASQQEIALVYSQYEEHLTISNLLDFDDLLLKCVQLLRAHPYCVENIEAVLVDEFQDTNHIQYELMRLFAQQNQNISIVGDPDQSIYGWRNAEIGNLKRMQSHYRETCVVKLEENYRSSGAILLTAQEIIEQDSSRPSKRLMPTHSYGLRPVLRKLSSATVEASWIVSEIKRSLKLAGGLLDLSDYAILLRSAALSRQIELALGKEGLAYRMVGGHKFFDRLEVKIVLDYLRVMSHPDHSDALARVLNVPSRKIGDVTLQNLLDESSRRKVTLWTLILGVTQGRTKLLKQLSSQSERGLSIFTNLVLTVRKKLTNHGLGDMSLDAFLDTLINKIDLEDYLKKLKPEEFDSRWANIKELISQAADFSVLIRHQTAEQAAIEGHTDIGASILPLEEVLIRFLANVALSADSQKEKSKEQKMPQLTISTIHAAKGLEWPVVFIPAVYDGSIPHSRAEETDEERRLLYVAMTRAQALLYLSNPAMNSIGGKTDLSQFLAYRNIESLFEKRGPNFSKSVADELAITLRRPKPNKEIIEEAIKSYPFIEDDQWPIDGLKEVSENVQAKSIAGDSSATLRFQTLGTNQHFRPPTRVRDDSGHVSTAFHVSTNTMQQANYSEKSTTLKTTFVSASKILALQNGKREESKENDVPTPASNVTGIGKKRKAAQELGDKSGQQSLNNFFVKRAR